MLRLSRCKARPVSGQRRGFFGVNTAARVRTARIDKLHDGYKVSPVLEHRLRIPLVESIEPHPNHLLVRFFQRQDLINTLRIRSPTISEHREDSSPFPSTYDITQVGTIGLSRSIFVNAREGECLDSEQVLHAFSSCGPIDHASPAGNNMHIHFLSVDAARKALQLAKQDPLLLPSIHADRAEFCTSQPTFLPAWCPSRELNTPDRPRILQISNVFRMHNTRRIVTTALRDKFEQHLLALQHSDDIMMLRFVSPLQARMFQQTIEPQLPQGNSITIMPDPMKLRLRTIHALHLGASRTLVMTLRSNDVRNPHEWLDGMASFGSVQSSSIVQKADSIEVYIQFCQLHRALNAMQRLQTGNHAIKGFENDPVRFKGTQNVRPVKISPSRSNKIELDAQLEEGEDKWDAYFPQKVYDSSAMTSVTTLNRLEKF